MWCQDGFGSPLAGLYLVDHTVFVYLSPFSVLKKKNNPAISLIFFFSFFPTIFLKTKKKEEEKKKKKEFLRVGENRSNLDNLPRLDASIPTKHLFLFLGWESNFAGTRVCTHALELQPSALEMLG